MKILIIAMTYLLSSALSAGESSIPEESFDSTVSFNFVVFEESPETFLVEMVTSDRGNIARCIVSAVITKPSGWKPGDNPFPDNNGDGTGNIEDILSWLNIDASGTYEQGIPSNKDPVWRGSYTVIEYVSTA